MSTKYNLINEDVCLFNCHYTLLFIGKPLLGRLYAHMVESKRKTWIKEEKRKKKKKNKWKIKVRKNRKQNYKRQKNENI
jgi:hypothetical protein